MICNLGVVGSNPTRGSPEKENKKSKGSFQSGQMGQTVNLLLLASVVRIHHYPQKSIILSNDALFYNILWISRNSGSADFSSW